jgi:FkbM family methyltransferase
MPWHPKKQGLLFHLVRPFIGRAERPLVTDLVWGGRLACDLRDVMQRGLYLFGTQEPLTEFLFQRLLQPGMTVLDVGANIGLYTVLGGRRVGNRGRVIAVEPVDLARARLKDNVALNGLENVVDIVPTALWSADTQVEMAPPESPSIHLGGYHVAQPGNGAFLVGALTLDRLVQQRGLDSLDVVKIDVEGSEPAVLAGGVETIRRFRPVIIMEVSIGAAAGLGLDYGGAFRELRQSGYRCFVLNERFRPDEGIEGVREVEAPGDLPLFDNVVFAQVSITRHLQEYDPPARPWWPR